MGGCERDHPTGPLAGPAAAGSGTNDKNNVRLTPESDTLDLLHQLLTLTANQPVTWTSLTPEITTVDEPGNVRGVARGLGLIQAQARHQADTAEVLVRQLVASVGVTPDSTDVDSAATVTLAGVAADANGYAVPDAVLLWSSDDPAVATVEDGVVTGVDAGPTTIRASVEGKATVPGCGCPRRILTP